MDDDGFRDCRAACSGENVRAYLRKEENTFFDSGALPAVPLHRTLFLPIAFMRVPNVSAHPNGEVFSVVQWHFSCNTAGISGKTGDWI